MADIELSTAGPEVLAGIRAALGTPEAARTLRFPDDEATPPSPVLPALGDRENMLLGFAAGGAPEEVDPAGLPGGSWPTISAAILAQSPYVYWPLNEISGTAIADASGNGRNATLSGTVWLAQAGPDGSNTAATFTAGRVTANTTWNHNEWTAVAWVKPTFSAPGIDPALFSQHEIGSVRYSTHFAADREGFVAWNGTTALVADPPVSQVDLLKDNAWYHVAIVRRSTSRMLFYVNGQLRIGGAFALGGATTQPLTFGASSTAFATPWIGGACHLAYWNRVLSEREIWKLYAAG